MALYETINYDDFLADLARQSEEERLRKLQEQANASQAKIEGNNGGLGGFLGGLVGGIGKGIGDVGKGVFDLLGSGAAAVKDIAEGKAGTGENQKAFKQWLYDTDNLKDAYAKSAGTSLNAATTLATTAVPGLTAAGAGTAALGGKALGGVAGNVGAGVIGGFADELQQQGENFNPDSAVNRMVSGATGALIGGKIGSKVGNANSKLGGALLNNKLATSTLGRGAIAGAAGGAAGAGTSAALGGGDILGSALQGATSGAMSGATQAGVASLGNRAIQRIGGTSTAQTTTTPEVEAKSKTSDGLDIPDYTKPTDYQGNEIKIEKKNLIQKLGDNLSKTGERIENADLYNSLYSKTAAQVTKNGTVDKLRQLGYNPADYKEAAKISTTTNKFVDDIVKNSGANIVDNGLVDRIAKPSTENTIATPAYQKVYDETVKQVFNTIENGDIPGRYNASDLLKASRNVNKIANKYAKKATSVNGGDLATDAGALADALMDVKYELRNLATKSVDGFGDNYTKAQLAERLKKLGATDAAIADMMEAKNIGEFISKTAKYEDARQMDYEMAQNELRRNAISGSKTNANPLQRLIQDSGAGEIVSVATRPAGKLAGKGARVAGGLISDFGASLNSGTNTNTTTNTKTQTQPLSADAQNLLGNFIGRTQGNIAANNLVEGAKTAQEQQNLEGLLSEIQNSENNLNAINLAQQQAQMQRQLSPIQTQLADIENGMNLALAAGDIQSYNTLASLYKNAYSIYQTQVKATQGESATSSEKLTEKQQKANAAASALDQLENMSPDFGYVVRDIPGLNIINRGGNSYATTADSLATQLGYLMSGAQITPAEFERIKAQYVPQPFDSDEQRKFKLQQARAIIQSYQNNKAA